MKIRRQKGEKYYVFILSSSNEDRIHLLKAGREEKDYV